MSRLSSGSALALARGVASTRARRGAHPGVSRARGCAVLVRSSSPRTVAFSRRGSAPLSAARRDGGAPTPSEDAPARRDPPAPSADAELAARNNVLATTSKEPSSSSSSSSSSSTTGTNASPGGTTTTTTSLRVASYIFGWYFLNAVFAIVNKRTLSAFPYPWILSWVQLAVGATVMALAWRVVPAMAPPASVSRWDAATFARLAPTSFFHLVAHVGACASYSLGSVSFMQVVKAGEPAVSVVLLTLFFNRRYSRLVWLALIPIVLGVAVGSTTELNFSLGAFACAMVSNVASALRSVTSKDLQDQTGDLRGIHLYGAMSVVGAIMLLPIAAALEGRHLIGGNNALSAASARFAESGATLFGVATPFVAYALVSAVLFHLYNQTSYQALALLSPLDISVANAVKRVVIILASVAAFRNPITPLGAAAAAVAVAGTFLYTLAAQKQRNEERGGGEDE